MTTARLFAQTFTAPATRLGGTMARRGVVAPLLVATVISLAFTAVLLPRADFEGPALEQLERKPDADQMSPHDREAAIAQARKVQTIGAWSAALLEPALRALVAAFFTWAAFRLALARPTFGATFSVMSWATLPLALRHVLTLPALWRSDQVAPDHVQALLPSSLAALLPDSASAQLRGFAGAFDLFSLWAVGLAALGMAQVAAVRRRRAATIVVLVWLAYVLLVDVALPGFRRTV